MTDIDAESELNTIPGLREKMQAEAQRSGIFDRPSTFTGSGIIGRQRPPSAVSIIEQQVAHINGIAIQLEELTGILVGLDDKSPLHVPASNVIEKTGGPVFLRLGTAGADLTMIAQRMEQLIARLRAAVM